ncbi:hypothetical protein MRX96_056610 [Rhipicephalus microplus]
MSNVATPSQNQQQFRTVEPRYLDVDRVDSLASTAALACGVLCVLLGLAVVMSAISFYKQQASYLRAQTIKTSRTTPSVRKKGAYVGATAVVHNAEAFYSIRQDYHGQDDLGDYCRERR